MKVVIDTNVLMSALYFGGNPLRVFDLFRDKLFDVYATPNILAEYSEVYEYLEEKTGRKADRYFYDTIVDSINIVPDNPEIKGSRDLKDDIFLGCAITCKALYIVSGDKDLLCLKEFEGVKIVTVAEFLKIFSHSVKEEYQ